MLIKTLFTIAGLVIYIACAFLFHQYYLDALTWIEGLGWLAPVLFIAIYCTATVLFLPTMVVTLAGGAFFGPVMGTIVNLLGATTGAIASFLLSRHLLRDWFAKKSGVRFTRFIRRVEQKGWLYVAALRLFPIIPFNLVNYGLGITQINFSLYLITTFIFLIPAEIFYTYCGYAGMEVIIRPENLFKNGGLVLLGFLLIYLIAKHVIKAKKPQTKPIYPLPKNESID